MIPAMTPQKLGKKMMSWSAVCFVVLIVAQFCSNFYEGTMLRNGFKLPDFDKDGNNTIFWHGGVGNKAPVYGALKLPCPWKTTMRIPERERWIITTDTKPISPWLTFRIGKDPKNPGASITIAKEKVTIVTEEEGTDLEVECTNREIIILRLTREGWENTLWRDVSRRIR